MVVSICQVYNKMGVYWLQYKPGIHYSLVHIATLPTQCILMPVCNYYIIHPVYTNVSVILSNVHWVCNGGQCMPGVQ
jgi:hypothetical protein